MHEKKYKVYNLHNFKSIPQLSNLCDEDVEAIEVVGHVLPFKANNYVVDELIDWQNVPEDPIFTLTFPRREMISKANYQAVLSMMKRGMSRSDFKQEVNKIRMRLNPNPAGQAHNVPMLEEIKLHGVQHKYRETVLFFPSQGQTCHAYCTFCFRWPQFTGINELKFAMKEANLLHRYLAQHKKATDILFTGGDPMTTTAKVLAGYIEPLLSKDFEHIRTIRIGSKSLAYWPYRYLTDKDADEVIRLFEKVVKAGKHLAFQAHFNHPVELSTNAVRQAIYRIKNAGAEIRTQSPLLRKINNHPAVWTEMWQKQIELGCIPYYMFLARDTGSKAFFEVPLEKAWDIYRKAYSHVSGVARTVRGPSMSAYPGKIHVVGITEVHGEKVFVLRFLQCRNQNLVGVPFFAKYDAKATWFDQLKPAFGEEEFFFEKDGLINKSWKGDTLLME